ncbi:2053_t:CDS:2, partial [Racocetra fulgida]
EKAEYQYKQIRIITPIQSYNKDTTQVELSKSLLPISNNEENSPSASYNSSAQLSETVEINENDVDDIDDTDDIEENWTHTVEYLISSLDNEDRLNNGEVVDSEPLEFDLYRRITHPVDDSLAKWSLLELFNDILEAPFKLNNSNLYLEALNDI